MEVPIRSLLAARAAGPLGRWAGFQTVRGAQEAEEPESTFHAGGRAHPSRGERRDPGSGPGSSNAAPRPHPPCTGLPGGGAGGGPAGAARSGVAGPGEGQHPRSRGLGAGAGLRPHGTQRRRAAGGHRPATGSPPWGRGTPAPAPGCVPAAAFTGQRAGPGPRRAAQGCGRKAAVGEGARSRAPRGGEGGGGKGDPLEHSPPAGKEERGGPPQSRAAGGEGRGRGETPEQGRGRGGEGGPPGRGR